jgi:hypothetical protein
LDHGETAGRIIKLGADHYIVSAIEVIDSKGGAPAFIRRKVGKRIFGAFGLWITLPTLGRLFLCLGHKNPKIMALPN